MNTEQILLSLTDLRHNLRQAQFPLDLPEAITQAGLCLLYTSPSPRDRQKSRMPSSA